MKEVLQTMPLKEMLQTTPLREPSKNDAADHANIRALPRLRKMALEKHRALEDDG